MIGGGPPSHRGNRSIRLGDTPLAEAASSGSSRSRTGDTHDATGLCRSAAWIGRWIRRRLRRCIGRRTDRGNEGRVDRLMPPRINPPAVHHPHDRGDKPRLLETPPMVERNGGVSFSASRSRAPSDGAPHEWLGPLRWRMRSPAIAHHWRATPDPHFPSWAGSPSEPRMRGTRRLPTGTWSGTPLPLRAHHCRFIHGEARSAFSLVATRWEAF